MNKKKFMQTDKRWAGLGYPKSPWFIRNCGCGLVSIANIIIEMNAFRNATPATIQPYCKQYAAPNGDGTYFSGIPKMMQHYGLTEVQEHATMSTLWKELEKGDRVAVYLMGKRPGGTKGVHWTSGGHFVCSVDYQQKNGKHYVYIKDSYSNSKLRNGFISYEENMRGDVLRVWSGKLKIEKAYYPSTPYTGSLPAKTVKKNSKGSDVKAVQTFLNWCINAGLAIDGSCGEYTDSAIRTYQNQYKLNVDGIFGSASKRKAEEIIKKYEPEKKKTIDQLAKEVLEGKWGSGDERKKKLTEAGYDYAAVQKKVNEILSRQGLKEEILSACRAQAEWMKNYKYKWQAKPTIEKSKKFGTCVTYVACVLQRIGYLKPGECIWHTEKGNVYGTTDRMQLTYYNGKALKDIKDKLEAGDVVIVGKKNVIKAGDSGSHIFIIAGPWSGGDPFIWDNHSATNVRKGKNGMHTYSGKKNVIAVIRLKEGDPDE